MVATGSPTTSTWRRFLASYADQIYALDLTVQHLWNYSTQYVLIILALHNRGTLKRECLDHFIFFSEGHLLRTATRFVRYYNEGRPHQGIQGIPSLGPGVGRVRDGPPGESSHLVAVPVLSVLHHDYRLAAQSDGGSQATTRIMQP